MKRFISKPGVTVDFTPKEVVPDPDIKDISVDRLIDDGLLVLFREIRQLKLLSARGKLEPNDARDLRDNVKLLFELKEREADSLKNLTDAELKTQAEEALKKDDNI